MKALPTQGGTTAVKPHEYEMMTVSKCKHQTDIPILYQNDSHEMLTQGLTLKVKRCFEQSGSEPQLLTKFQLWLRIFCFSTALSFLLSQKTHFHSLS